MKSIVLWARGWQPRASRSSGPRVVGEGCRPAPGPSGPAGRSAHKGGATLWHARGEEALQATPDAPRGKPGPRPRFSTARTGRARPESSRAGRGRHRPRADSTIRRVRGTAPRATPAGSALRPTRRPGWTGGALGWHPARVRKTARRPWEAAEAKVFAPPGRGSRLPRRLRLLAIVCSVLASVVRFPLNGDAPAGVATPAGDRVGRPSRSRAFARRHLGRPSALAKA